MADIPGDSSTSESVTVGTSLTGALEVTGDHDWYKIQLTAGLAVTISLEGITLEDTYLRIRDSAGNIIYENDDISAGVNRDSLLSFSATYTGTYYIDVGAWNDDYAGDYQLSVTEYIPPPLGTYDQIAEQIVSGYWGGYSHNFDTAGGSITVNLTALTADGQALAREALALWSDIIGVDFPEVLTGGQVTFDDNDQDAYADVNWTTDGTIVSAHINISTQWLADYGTSFDSYSFQTYIHEIGHALGLGHAGNYNGDARYPYDALFENDGWSTTVMSYFDQQENTHFAGQGFTREFAVTPMLADILGMSLLYGLSTTTRTGDTTYGFNSTAGRDVYNASIYPSVAYTIYDSGGTDALDYSGFSVPQRIDLNPERFSNVGGLTGNVSIARGVVIENAIGGSGDDELIGNSAANGLYGGVGDDQLRGGAGDDWLEGESGADAMYGGFGNDTFVVERGDDVIVEGSGEGIDQVRSSLSYVLGANLENLTLLGTAALDGTGNGLANLIAGNSAANKLDGLDGDDALHGDAGNDRLDGGAGTDTIYGGTGDDELHGGAGNDWLEGESAADAMYGGLWNDTIVVDSGDDVVVEAAGEGTDQVRSSLTYVLGANLENLTLLGTAALNGTGNDLANVVTGNSAVNRLYGLDGDDALVGKEGNDRLDGGAGADKMYGGTGDDIFFIDSPYDAAVEYAGEGTDIVYASVSYGLRANVERLTLTGTANLLAKGNELGNIVIGNSGANRLYGRDGADTLFGKDGNDRLHGGTGADKMYGGAGNDIYYVDASSDAAFEYAGEGIDIVYASASYALRPNVERLILTGTANLLAKGNDLDNIVIGNSGANRLYGLDGVDTLFGKAGNDRVDGGAGADKMYGSIGNDIYYVDNSSDAVIEYAGEGTDLVYASADYALRDNIERLTLTGTGDLVGKGNALANIISGNAGANQLYGFGGNDLLVAGGGADVLRGGAGRDRMYGGAGDDRFVFDDGEFGGASASSADQLHDFSSAGGDRLDLALVDANSTLGGDQAFAFIGTAAFTGTVGELRYEQISSHTYVQGDTNGDGVADFWIRIDGLHTLGTGDFLL